MVSRIILLLQTLAVFNVVSADTSIVSDHLKEYLPNSLDLDKIKKDLEKPDYFQLEDGTLTGLDSTQVTSATANTTHVILELSLNVVCSFKKIMLSGRQFEQAWTSSTTYENSKVTVTLEVIACDSQDPKVHWDKLDGLDKCTTCSSQTDNTFEAILDNIGAEVLKENKLIIRSVLKDALSPEEIDLDAVLMPDC